MRTTASIDAGSGTACVPVALAQLPQPGTSRSRRGPGRSVETRNLDPVTVPAAPRNCSVGARPDITSLLGGAIERGERRPFRAELGEHRATGVVDGCRGAEVSTVASILATRPASSRSPKASPASATCRDAEGGDGGLQGHRASSDCSCRTVCATTPVARSWSSRKWNPRSSSTPTVTYLCSWRTWGVMRRPGRNVVIAPGSITPGQHHLAARARQDLGRQRFSQSRDLRDHTCDPSDGCSEATASTMSVASTASGDSCSGRQVARQWPFDVVSYSQPAGP